MQRTTDSVIPFQMPAQMPVQSSNPRIFLSAGEASGEHYGALLMQAIREHLPQASFFGLGGLEMGAAGMQRVVKAEQVAVMGITEVLRHAPRIYGEYRRLVRSIQQQRPDVAVLIDFPDVNLRLARELKALGVPVIYFVSPQLWAWKKRRIRWVQERVSQMLVIFPFEETFYRARGVDARFVGHPLAELPLPGISREALAAQYGLNPARHWIALLPGSRRKEVKLNLPGMLQTAALLGEEYEFLLPVASTLRHEAIAALMLAYQSFGIGSAARLHLVDDARAALFHARASVVASGTATVQAAVIGNPFLVVYRVSGLTYKLARRLVSYPPEIPAEPDKLGNVPVAMVNLIAGRRIVPELLQQEFTGRKVVAHLQPLLAETETRRTMQQDLAQVRRALQMPVCAPPLGEPAGLHPIQQVCQAVLQHLGR